MPSESCTEYRVCTKIDNQGSGVFVTRDARAAGTVARRNRGWLASAGLGGEVGIQSRTVAVAPWVEVETVRVEPKVPAPA